jgi:hypothetical protein
MPGNRWRSSTAAAKFAPLLVDGADRRGIGLSDDEHRWSMGGRALVG